MEFLRPLARQRGMRLEFSAAEPEICLLGRRSPAPAGVYQSGAERLPRHVAGRRLARSVRAAARRTSCPFGWYSATKGSGFRSQNLDRIFEAGFTTNPGSPGLGLALTKKVVEQHRGKIWVESVPGKGTTFTLGFPRSGAGDESGTGCG